MRILITGGTGFVGQHLVAKLRHRGDEVVVATRNADRARKIFGATAEPLAWDPLAGPPDLAGIDSGGIGSGGIDAVINLMGENIGKGRWTRAKKKRIRESRIVGTRNLVTGMAGMSGMAGANSKPAVLVSASAIGYYGATGHNSVSEGYPPAENDFLADVCREWEAEAIVARGSGIRAPIVRSGVILGREGGAYCQLRRVFKLGLGGTIGLGTGWFSWVHIDDVVGVFLHCLDDAAALDVYNATAPHPVSNMEFTRELARSLHRPAIVPVPPLALRVVAGEFGKYVAMSQRVQPLRTIGLGYEFKYPKVREALQALAGSPA